MLLRNTWGTCATLSLASTSSPASLPAVSTHSIASSPALWALPDPDRMASSQALWPPTRTLCQPKCLVRMSNKWQDKMSGRMLVYLSDGMSVFLGHHPKKVAVRIDHAVGRVCAMVGHIHIKTINSGPFGDSITFQPKSFGFFEISENSKPITVFTEGQI